MVPVTDVQVSPSVVEGEEEHPHYGFPGDVDPWHLRLSLGEGRACSNHPHHSHNEKGNTENAHISFL